MRLATKFTFWFLVGMCAVLSVSAYLQVRREVALFEDDMRRDHEVIGRSLAGAVTMVGQESGKRAALQYINQSAMSDQRVRIHMFPTGTTSDSATGMIVPESVLSELAQGKKLTSLYLTERGEQRLHTFVPVTVGGQRLGTIDLSESLADERSYIRATVIWSAAKTGLVILVSGVVAAVLGSVVVGRPVRALIGGARRVATGDFSGRVLLRQSDEFAELAAELNTMCDRLAEAEIRIAAEISARRATAEQLRHANRLTTVGRLSSSIAHEIGTPLNIILLRANMIVADDLSASDVRENARTIVEQSRRLTGMILEMLDFARRRSPIRVSADLYHVVGQTLALLVPMACRRGVSLNFIKEDGPAFVLVDPDQIQQVVSNLVINGIDAMPNGGTLTLGINQHQRRPHADGGPSDREFAHLYVDDEGGGISEENMPHLFEPFFTTKVPDQGTGLGLSIAADIVREHGGQITVDRRPNSGMRFSVYLPQEPATCEVVS